MLSHAYHYQSAEMESSFLFFSLLFAGEKSFFLFFPPKFGGISKIIMQLCVLSENRSFTEDVPQIEVKPFKISLEI